MTKKTQSEGKTLEEANNINKRFCCLSRFLIEFINNRNFFSQLNGELFIIQVPVSQWRWSGFVWNPSYRIGVFLF